MSVRQTTMGRPREFDADEALDEAMLVFWRKGYLGASLTDLTDAMGINRPSLYATFGNKESLFRKALDRYSEDRANYIHEAVTQPTAREVARFLLRSTVQLITNSTNPRGCLWVQGMLSCGDPADPLRKELAARRNINENALRKRFQQAIADHDLPPDADPAALARFVTTMACGLAVQAAAGSTRAQLLLVIDTALQGWPK